METTHVTVQEADEEELISAAADTPMSPVPADPLPSASPSIYRTELLQWKICNKD